MLIKLDTIKLEFITENRDVSQKHWLVINNKQRWFIMCLRSYYYAEYVFTIFLSRSIDWIYILTIIQFLLFFSMYLPGFINNFPKLNYTTKHWYHEASLCQIANLDDKPWNYPKQLFWNTNLVKVWCMLYLRKYSLVRMTFKQNQMIILFHPFGKFRTLLELLGLLRHHVLQLHLAKY